MFFFDNDAIQELFKFPEEPLGALVPSSSQ